MLEATGAGSLSGIVRQKLNMPPDAEYTGSVMLMVLGDNLEPDEVSARLELVPSQAWRKGECLSFVRTDGVKLEYKSKHAWGGWKRFIEPSQAKFPIETQMEFWYKRLHNHIAALTYFKSKGWDCALDLFVTTDATASLVFSSALQKKIAELGVELRISFWAAEPGEQQRRANERQPLRSARKGKSRAATSRRSR